MAINVITAESQAEVAASPAVADAKEEATKSAPGEKSPSETAEASDATDVKDDVEEQDASAEEGEEESQDDEEQKPKKRSGFKRRIDKLNSRNTGLQREIEYWKTQALKDSKAPAQDLTQAQKADAPVNDRPKANAFDSHEEYVEALTDWKIEKREQEREEKAKAQKAQAEVDGQIKSHLTRVESFKSSKDDWDDVIESVDDIAMSPVVQEAILQSENGPELMYELAKNRDEYARICKLPAVAAARELGKFEARLAREAKVETKEVKATKAPKPVTPVGAKSGVVSKSIYDPNISQREYERLRAERMRRA